jgi:hypothetical protein
MPPEILTEFKCVCCKSQDISCGIRRLGKIRFAFGSRIAGAICKKENWWLSDKFENSGQNCPETCVSDVLFACYTGVTSESAASVR